MYLESTTGWLGHYKVSHIFPTDVDEEYISVESNNGFPHVVVHNTADGEDGSVDWRTDGQFEVRKVIQ